MTEDSSSRRRTGSGDMLPRGSSHNAAAGKGRRGLLTKSLSKEDLNVKPVNDFFAEFEEDEEFAVDWNEDDAATATSGDSKPEKAQMARSRRLGPGDRRKEMMRRNSSRRLLGDSTHGGSQGDNSLSRSRHGDQLSRSRHDSKSSDDDMPRRSRRPGSNRHLEVSDSKEEDLIAEVTAALGGKTSIRNLRAEFSGGRQSSVPNLRAEMEMSFSDLPKDWQGSAADPAAASILASPRRAPHRAKSSTSTNIRHGAMGRRASMDNNGRTPAMQRRLSMRGLATPEPPLDDADEDAMKPKHPPRRHSMLGASDGRPSGLTMVPRQPSQRSLLISKDDEGEGQGCVGGGGGRRTTTIPRRLSTGGGAAGCKEMVGRRPSVTTSHGLTGESIAAMGNANIRW